MAAGAGAPEPPAAADRCASILPRDAPMH